MTYCYMNEQVCQDVPAWNIIVSLGLGSRISHFGWTLTEVLGPKLLGTILPLPYKVP